MQSWNRRKTSLALFRTRGSYFCVKVSTFSMLCSGLGVYPTFVQLKGCPLRHFCRALAAATTMVPKTPTIPRIALALIGPF